MGSEHIVRAIELPGREVRRAGRDADLTFVRAVADAADGNIALLNAAGREMDLTRDRALELRSRANEQLGLPL